MAKPEALNAGAISVINRVSAKLTGRDFRPASKKTLPASAIRSTREQFTDFSPDLSSGPRESTLQNNTEWPLSTPTQVERLISEASRTENLCQAYVGW